MLIYGLDHLAVARGRMTKALNRVTGGDCPASSYGEALLMNPQLGLFPRGVPQRVPELTGAMRLALQWKFLIDVFLSNGRGSNGERKGAFGKTDNPRNR